MTANRKLGGIWCAVATPLDARLNPDAAKAVAYYAELLRRGCDGINLLGTTGEAMSLSLDQRIGLMEAVANSDLPIDRVMVGTGAASLHDAVRLTQAAFDRGFAAALVMPPFFFRDASARGVVAFFDALISRTSAPRNRILLYNFPRMSGITFDAALVARLLEAFPGRIAGMKDSSNDRALQAGLIARHPELAVFAASEEYLLEAKAYGAAGCISATAALWPRFARDVFVGGDPAKGQRLSEMRRALSAFKMIPAVRCVIARASGDDTWERPLPPLVALTPAEKAALEDALNRFV